MRVCKEGVRHLLEEGVSVIQGVVKTLPSTPGVYRMLNHEGKVLYVGKARRLSLRVRAYTRPSALPLRLQRMISQTCSMEIVTTHTEAEALLLEANLIKKFQPPFNVLLKDGKSFSYLLFTDHPYPLLKKYRGIRDEKGVYFGPFASAEAVYETLLTLQKVFLLRSCPDTVFSHRQRPCLQYDLKRCSAPCVNKISFEDYQSLVHEAQKFLRGQSSELQDRLATEMSEASEQQLYEKAAVLRDRLKALVHVQQKQTINTMAVEDADVLGMYTEGAKTCVQLFFFRHGSNFGTTHFFLDHGPEEPPATILEGFLGQFYGTLEAAPLILVNEVPHNIKLLEEALKSKIVSPRSGPRRALLIHAQSNAKEAFLRKMAESASQKKLISQLADRLGLKDSPERIEVYDNSHLFGESAIGAMIVFTSDGFLKQAYRKYTMKTAQDDYGMMREVLSRRFRRGGEEHWPGLVILDGGAGQLSVAQQVFEDLGITDVPLLAIAKGPKRNAGEETFHMEGRSPFSFPKDDHVLHFLQRLRDEAHRFAIGTHRKKRHSRALKLENVEGVGLARKRALLQYFGSLVGIRSAGLHDLEKVKGISKSLAKKIYDFYHDAN